MCTSTIAGWIADNTQSYGNCSTICSPAVYGNSEYCGLDDGCGGTCAGGCAQGNHCTGWGSACGNYYCEYDGYGF